LEGEKPSKLQRRGLQKTVRGLWGKKSDLRCWRKETQKEKKRKKGETVTKRKGGAHSAETGKFGKKA